MKSMTRDYAHVVNVALANVSVSGRRMSPRLGAGKGRHHRRRSNDSDIPRNQQRSLLCDDIFRWKENPTNRATHGLPQRRVQISVSSQSSSRRLESSGLGQAVNVEHKNRRETPEHSSSSADMVLRKSGVGHEWNSMTLQAAATAEAAQSCQPPWSWRKCPVPRCASREARS